MIWDREDPDPLAVMVSFTWDEVMASWGPVPAAEVWLNPADWESLGRPADYMGAPVKISRGVLAGTARIFDRARLRYLPPARLPAFTRPQGGRPL